MISEHLHAALEAGEIDSALVATGDKFSLIVRGEEDKTKEVPFGVAVLLAFACRYKSDEQWVNELVRWWLQSIKEPNTNEK